MKINVGTIINAVILNVVRTNNVGLQFPSLLTELLEKVGINMMDNFICKTIRELDLNGIIRIWNNQPEEGEEGAGPSRG
ncbi:hypothetical protein TIFTF001_031724 [Ficus carica]|uniref:Uncharacterized protein n=1 Tax=Ficus carica TaxID=3494 RepID=A0AA88J5U4_FICCA|nr:hypothetical protein TIFTF001_031724 [Ficus carica]